MNLKIIIFVSIITILIVSLVLVIKYKPDLFNMGKTSTGTWVLKDTGPCLETNSQVLNYGCYVDDVLESDANCGPNTLPKSKECKYSGWKSVAGPCQNTSPYNKQALTYDCYVDGVISTDKSKCESSVKLNTLPTDKKCYYGTWIIDNTSTSSCNYSTNSQDLIYGCYKDNTLLSNSSCDSSLLGNLSKTRACGKSSYKFYGTTNTKMGTSVENTVNSKFNITIDATQNKITIPSDIYGKFILISLWYANNTDVWYTSNLIFSGNTGNTVSPLTNNKVYYTNTYLTVDEININKSQTSSILSLTNPDLPTASVNAVGGELFIFTKQRWCRYTSPNTLETSDPLGNLQIVGGGNLSGFIEIRRDNNTNYIFIKNGSPRLLFIITFKGIQVGNIDDDLKFPTFTLTNLTSTQMTTKSGTSLSIKGNNEGEHVSKMIYMTVLNLSDPSQEGAIRVGDNGKYARETYTEFFMYEY